MAKASLEIKSLARAHTETALNVLAGIMNEPTAPHAARVSAAQALLDRGWGKPNQTIEQTGEVRHYVARLPAPSTNMDEWQRQHADRLNQTIQ